MTTIPLGLAAVLERVARACAIAQRPVDSVTLLAVSKTQPAQAVRAAFDAGQCAFGENYVQEAVAKMEALHDLRPHTQWHLIGPLQGNKAKLVAQHFDWVHSIDRLDIAERLSRARPAGSSPLQVCLQVNISGEDTKHGLPPQEVEALAHAVARLPGLRLRGLMSIPEPAETEAARRAPHRALRELLQHLVSCGLPLDTLSMGMSADLEAAIAEGATLVRVGTAIFGDRTRNQA